MTAYLHTGLLWLAVLWPLLLALPGRHRHLRAARYLALLPALVLLVWPGQAALQLPWLLFGAGLGIDSNSRWLLGAVLVVWVVAIHLLRAGPQGSAPGETTVSLLTLSGSLGVVLATDLSTFFVFATLMGYAFYGLLVQHADARAARRYVMLLVLADLALFESLLLAAFATSDLRYAAVHQSLSSQPGAAVYLWMVLLGFVLKAGLWPAHAWLFACYSSATRPLKTLLAGAPVAMALLGALRWLPLGQAAQPRPATALLLVGIGTLALALYQRIRYPERHTPTALAMGSGGFILFLAAGLASPAFWQDFGFLAYPLAALAGLLPLVTLFSMTEAARPLAGAPSRYPLRDWSGAGGPKLRAWLEATRSALPAPQRSVSQVIDVSQHWLGQGYDLLNRLESRLRRWPLIMGVWLLLAVLIGVLAWGR